MQSESERNQETSQRLRQVCAGNSRIFEGLGESLRNLVEQRDSAEELFQAITSAANDAVLMSDWRGRITFSNRAAREVFGYAGDEIRGRQLHELLAPGRFSREWRVRLPLFRSTGRLDPVGGTVETTALRKDGTAFPIELSLASIKLADEWNTISILRDISPRKQAEQDLQVNEDRFRNLVERNQTGIVMVDRRGHCKLANPKALSLLGRSMEEIRDEPLGLPAITGNRSEIDVIRSGGDWGVAEITVSETEWDGAPAYLMMLHDISERVAEESKVRKMAYHDGLTGLPNRLLFYDRLEKALVRAKRQHSEVGVLFLDLDNFKPVNDSLGHNAGDRLLREVGARLRRCLRENDTVARLGGDEFTLILEDLKPEHSVRQVAEKVLDTLCSAFSIDGEDFHLSASIGASLFPDHGYDAETLLRRADGAMYAAKQNGKNCLRVFTPEIEINNSDKLRLKSRLFRALERNEFVLHYQPQVDLGTGRLVGVEALLRWEDPERGLVLPDQFLPLLEESGGIRETENWVLRTACRQSIAWQEAGLPPFRLAVNLSTQDIARGGTADLVARVLDETGHPPQRLELEITESALLQTSHANGDFLRPLKNMGVQIALDHFGMGYSSLSNLHRFCFDRLKIDRSFISGLPTDAHGAAISTAMVAMARALGLDVLAGGLETRAQLSFLNRLECSEAQGFFFSRPLPADELQDFLLKNPQVSRAGK